MRPVTNTITTATVGLLAFCAGVVALGYGMSLSGSASTGLVLGLCLSGGLMAACSAAVSGVVMINAIEQVRKGGRPKVRLSKEAFRQMKKRPSINNYNKKKGVKDGT